MQIILWNNKNKTHKNLLILIVLLLQSIILNQNVFCDSRQDELARRALERINKSLSKLGIASLPNSSGLVSSRISTSSTGLNSSSVSGTPPTIKEIAGSSTIKDIFWRPGIIDAVADDPTPMQCTEYFYGGKSGFSGGQAACRVAETVGYSFQTILDGGFPLCVMQKFPTQENLTAGGITLVSGAFPKGKVERLFIANNNSNRTIKVDFTDSEGEKSVFIKVYSNKRNELNRDFYRADLWFCRPEESIPYGYNVLDINDQGEFKSVLVGDDGAGNRYISTMKGYLSGKNQLSFNERFEKTVQFEKVETGEGSFKSDIVVFNNELVTKSFDTIGNFTSKSYIAARISGTDFHDLRVLEGAFHKLRKKPGSSIDNFYGATEWRESAYLAAPKNSLIESVLDHKFSEDPYYSTQAKATVDVSKYSCDDSPDIEIEVDVYNSTVQASLLDCLDLVVDGMHFCHDDSEVQAAEENFLNACTE